MRGIRRCRIEKQVRMLTKNFVNINNYSIGFLNAPNITGVLVFLAVKYGHREESPVPYYRRKDFKDYDNRQIVFS